MIYSACKSIVYQKHCHCHPIHTNIYHSNMVSPTDVDIGSTDVDVGSTDVDVDSTEVVLSLTKLLLLFVSV